MISIIFSKEMNFGWVNHDGHLNYHMFKEEDNKIVAPRQKSNQKQTDATWTQQIYVGIYRYINKYIYIY